MVMMDQQQVQGFRFYQPFGVIPRAICLSLIPLPIVFGKLLLPQVL
jgi:hypothetical protein